MKKYVSILLMLTIPFVASCSVLVPTKYDYNLKKSQITEEHDNFTGVGYTTTFYSTDENNMIFSNFNFDFDLDGRNTFMKIDVKKKSSLTITCDFTNVSGKFSIVATDNKKWIEKIFSIDNKDSKEMKTIELNKGNYYVKVIADNAKFDMGIDLDYSLEDMDIVYTTMN